MREGEVAPGTAGVWKNLTAFTAHEGGDYAFNGLMQVGTGGVTKADDHGVWAAMDSGLDPQLVVRSGEILNDDDADPENVEVVHRAYISESPDGGGAGRSSPLACGNLAVILTFDQNRQTTVWIMGVPEGGL